MSNLARANSVDALIRRAAARTPNAVALHFSGRSHTYAELDAAISRAAGRLLSLGLEPGDRIAAYGTNSDAYAIAFFAASRAGLVHVPVNFALQGEELSYILADSGATALLVDAALRPHFDAVASDTSIQHVLDFREGPDSLLAQASAGEIPELAPPAGGDDLVQLMYTSGTTSKPKGTMISHSGQIYHYLACLQALDYAADDRPLVCMPLYHTAAMHAFLVPYLAIGAEVFLHERPDIPVLLEAIERDSIGSMFLAPTVWVPLSHHPDLDLRDISSLKKAQYGASIMPTPVLQRLRAKYPELGFYNAFGQTEIGPVATVLRPEEHDERPASAGRPVMFVEARVIDAEGNDVAPGEQGEIVYRSPQLCLGYWNKPEATEEAFEGGWFHSGDLVVRDEQGYVTVVDRIKDVINTGGVLVASREVEEAIYGHESVAEVAVVGMPHERWIEQVTAFVVVKDGAAEPTEDEIVEFAAQSIASFKVPKQVIFVPQLPRNQSGKLLKRVLRDEH
ncbi:fatty acyl-CoA synthetase [Dietzia timorensis]|uniref:Long-chain-fatty-acid--CoA ligase FadD13 n=1 Tax=Dietzia timorensis TaxID=499555 RepID=A0A173LQ60_9ACTN|nr:fatty acyl-CoA synthetase [Dietzia timorensis]ANI93844.1 Long-chain-fatty-acid--CoA ligase FadD13 [Dietzia timorensis]